MICPNCNCELVDGTAVCPYCGTPLAAPAPSATATATMPAIQSAPPAAPAPSPAYRAEDIPVSAAPQPAARGAHEQVSQSPEPPFAYGREEAAESPASPARDPYEDYYRQAPARPSAQAYREPAPQPARDPYEDYYRPTPGRGGQGPAARDPYGEPRRIRRVRRQRLREERICGHLARPLRGLLPPEPDPGAPERTVIPRACAPAGPRPLQ